MSKKDQFKPEDKEKQLRVFVSTVNTLAGQAIVETLRNDNYNDSNPHIIIGTVDKDDPTPACRGVKRVINVEIASTGRRPKDSNEGGTGLRCGHLRRPQSTNR